MRFISLFLAGSLIGVPSVLYGDLLGLGRATVIVGAVAGSMFGVAVNLIASDWISARLRRRARAKGTTSRTERIAERAGPLMDRLGLVGFGLVGPVVLGTFGSALIGPMMGSSRRRVFMALLIGVTFWCVVFAIVSDLLVDNLGPE